MPGAKTSIAGFIAIAASALTLASPAMAAEPRIVGGGTVPIEEYPYQVHLDIEGRDGTFGCGGSILDATTVVTAAHCVTDDATDEDGNATGGTGGVVNPRYVTVGYGSADLDDVTKVAVSEVEMPKDYPANYSFDVARIELATPLVGYGGLKVDRIPLATGAALSAGITAGSDVWVSGWGAIAENGQGSDTLKAVDLPLRPDSACSPLGTFYVPAFAICVGGTGTANTGNDDSCQGDSGGPVSLPDANTGADQLVGIVAFGNGCGRKETAGAYTEVTNTSVRAVIEKTDASLVQRGTEAPLYPRDVPATPSDPVTQTPPPAQTVIRPIQPVQVKDTVKPTLRLLKTTCKKGGSCTLRLAVADNSGNVAKVSATASQTTKKCKRVKGKRKCKKVTKKTSMKAKRVAGGFDISAKLKKGTYSLTAVGTDASGNKSLTFKKTLKVKR